MEWRVGVAGDRCRGTDGGVSTTHTFIAMILKKSMSITPRGTIQATQCMHHRSCYENIFILYNALNFLWTSYFISLAKVDEALYRYSLVICQGTYGLFENHGMTLLSACVVVPS